jgi:DHA2 family multidrug resistance protein-like MFS transporter
MERSGAAAGMLATARLSGQTLGATLTAILFRAAPGFPGLSLVVAAVFAAGASLVSFGRLADRSPRAPPAGAPR